MRKTVWRHVDYNGGRLVYPLRVKVVILRWQELESIDWQTSGGLCEKMVDAKGRPADFFVPTDVTERSVKLTALAIRGAVPASAAKAREVSE